MIIGIFWIFVAIQGQRLPGGSCRGLNPNFLLFNLCSVMKIYLLFILFFLTQKKQILLGDNWLDFKTR